MADDRPFYVGRLRSADYEAWLHALAVRFVAVADAPTDPSARAEVRLVRGGLPYLPVVARLRHWTVYRVRDATALASGAGRLVSMGPNQLTVAVRHPGLVRLQVRFSPLWQLSGVRGCVAARGGFTAVQARTSGTAHLRMSFTLSRIDSRAPRCD